MKLIKKYYFKQKRKILNILLHRFTYLYRPSSEPYISGDTFRKHSDYIYDESKKFNPKKIKTNDIVFISSNLIEEYFSKIHTGIKNRYILISHNSDRNINEKEKAYSDDRIIYWFAQNLNAKQDKTIGPIPIGLENLRYQLNGILKDFQSDKPLNKSKTILLSFSKITNLSERNKVIEIFKNNTLIDNKIFSNHSEFFSELKKYKFNLCPEGNGLDTHRIWESLIAEVIPIMIRNTFTENLESFNFPILLLEKWEELNSFTLDDFNNYYKNEIESKNFFEIVNYEHWLKKINLKKI